MKQAVKVIWHKDASLPRTDRKSYLPTGVYVHPADTRFLGPMKVCPPSRFTISSAVFAQSTRVPNAQKDAVTDGTFGVYSNRPPLCSECDVA